MSTEDRRAPGAARIPFDALVEVGGALGPTFEAQAVNVSEEGMQLRTAYLPEPGQPLTCRFDGGPGQTVVAVGEVAWAQGVDRGGEFGVRFTEIDALGVEALRRICGLTRGSSAPDASSGAAAGARVRLHIEGLAAPMRAKVKETAPSAVTVGSDLSFLQVGRPLELEDAQSGVRRPACIDRVDVAVDPASQVPQLVVTLRYAEDATTNGGGRLSATAASGHEHARESKDSAVAGAPRSSVPSRPGPADDDLSAVEQASFAMKGAVARGIQAIGPAVGRFASQAKTMIGLLGPRRAERGDDVSTARRTTAPAPGGGLHASGRRVVRSAGGAQERDELPALPKAGWTARRAAVAGGVMTAAILGALALKKGHHEPAPAPAPVASASAEVAAPAPSTLASALPVASQAPQPSSLAAEPTASAPGPADEHIGSDDEKSARHKHPRVAPFASGPVHHGNVLHLKMDGPIDAIEGAAQPTGFAVKIPGRKSLEAAAPLAARDGRIAAIKVTNGSAGAELTVSFKDGVPTYRVSARGDTLVIALAPPGPVEPPIAKKNEKGGQSASHARRTRTDEL